MNATVRQPRPAPMRQRTCPVCAIGFQQSWNVTPWPSDTCRPRCAIALEQFADKHDLPIEEAARSFMDNSTK